MIGIERQNNLLLAIGQKFKEPIKVYAVGGTAMMFLGLKDATLDIDLVFESDAERLAFSSAAKDLGYKETASTVVYGAKANKPIMLALGDERFDLFAVRVIDFTFSENMKRRAENVRQYGNLFIHVASPHDIILMKCATDRAKDLDDANRIIRNVSIDWKIIISEAKNQIELGEAKSVWELASFLENLNQTLENKIPSSVSEELWNILRKYASERAKLGDK